MSTNKKIEKLINHKPDETYIGQEKITTAIFNKISKYNNAKLLIVLTFQKSGFNMTSKALSEKTGLLATHLSRARTELIEEGYITIDENKIIINYNIIINDQIGNDELPNRLKYMTKSVIVNDQIGNSKLPNRSFIPPESLQPVCVAGTDNLFNNLINNLTNNLPAACASDSQLDNFNQEKVNKISDNQKTYYDNLLLRFGHDIKWDNWNSNDVNEITAKLLPQFGNPIPYILNEEQIRFIILFFHEYKGEIQSFINTHNDYLGKNPGKIKEIKNHFSYMFSRKDDIFRAIEEIRKWDNKTDWSKY